jgi:hypothetical protein
MGMSIDIFAFYGENRPGIRGNRHQYFFRINESMNLSHILLEKRSKIGTTKQSPVESGGLILVYMYIK